MKIGPQPDVALVRQTTDNAKESTALNRNETPRDDDKASAEPLARLAELADQDRLIREEPTEAVGYDARDIRNGQRGAPAQSNASSDAAHEKKLAAIKERIESGFYDSPEVRDRIAERMAEELGKPDQDHDD